MVLNNIEKLLEKYDNAETTLQEEAQLRDYFTSDNVAPHLEYYKPMFVHFSKAHEDAFTKDVPLNTKKKTRLYQWISVAAVAVLMLGIMIPQYFGPTDKEKEEALLAYNQTLEMFNLISVGLNQGQRQLEAVSSVSDNITDSAKHLSIVSQLNESTNKFFKTNN